MTNTTLANTLLSLFTTKQRATEIEGDLIEERECRGQCWFIAQVFSITFYLFRASYKNALLQVTLLAASVTTLSVLTCSGFSWLFFGANALLPLPYIGIFMVPVWAFLIGAGFEYLSPRVGVRATTLAAMMLMILGFFTLAQSALIFPDADRGVEYFMWHILVTLVTFISSLIFSIFIFLIPLITGSAYIYNRSGKTD